MTNNDNMEDKSLIKKDNVELTEQNWLMYKYIQQGMTVKDAYANAGYKGKNPQAPYQLYHKLKKKLEIIWDSDNADSLRLKMEAKKIADMPLKEKEIKAETKLKAIETLYKLQGGEKTEKKTISPFIVFKAEDGKVSASQGQVIDVTEVESKEVE